MSATFSNVPNNSWQSKWGSQIDSMLAQGRRNSAASIIQRLRSGSLTGWAGGPIFSNPFKSTHFAPGEGQEFNEGQASQPFRLQQRIRRMSIDPSIWKKHGNASLGSVLSALYAKLLVVMGMAFPMSEVISTYVPPAYYDGFYLYLYFVSILFMAWLFSHVIKQRAKKEITKGVSTIKSRLHNHNAHKSVTDGSAAEDKNDNEDDEVNEEVATSEAKTAPVTILGDLEEDDRNSQETSKLTSSSESTSTAGSNTHSEDSDDKLSPLPTDDQACSPLLIRRPSPMPVPIMAGQSILHPLQTPTISVHPPTLPPPINHPHHHHHLHVTINSPPGHDGFPSSPSSSPRLQQHHHHHHHQQPRNQLPDNATAQIHQILKNKNSQSKNNGSDSPHTKGKLSRTQSVESGKYDYAGQRSHFGSFYLRMGAVAFGIGSMIYSCLEFGQFLEQDPHTKCHSYMQAITPVVRIVFTFMQMYFIFLNSRMSVSKVSWVKQFGLMHMIGTNLCVWLNVLVQETKHEILHFYDPVNGSITVGYGLNYYGKPKMVEEHAKVVAAASSTSIASALIGDDPDHPHYGGGFGESSEEDDPDMFMAAVNRSLGGEQGAVVINRLKRGLKGPHSMYECARENIMGSLVNTSSPFLFPCTIEYSLICAAICYVMWKSMAKRRVREITLKRTNTNDLSINHPEVRNVHHYTVDCAGSNKGLFIGIFFLVFTIMSLILNFVLMKHHEHLEFAFWEVNLTEVTLYAVSTLAVLVGMCQMRQLRYESGKNLELDNILLIVAQSGSLMFNVFCIVGGQLTPLEGSVWILITPLLCLIQLLLQTLFILDASKRVVSTPELARKKPGREIVTFLLVTNLAMWLVNALEKSRGDSHPHLLRFYGVWAWTIITDIAMPLAIFYRFHSTVCLCEIWKKAYKVRNKYTHEPLMHV